jgi:hypothetical protein
MGLPHSAPDSRPGRNLKKSLLVWFGCSLIALVVACLSLGIGERRTLGFILEDPRCVAGVFIFALATIGLGVGLTRRQETVALVAVVAMVLSGSCTAITFFFGGRVRDLTPVMYERLGGDEAEPKGPAQDRENGLPHRD